MNRKICFGSFFVISLLIVAAYSNTLESPFVLDDYHSFVQNPEVRVEHWSWESIWSMAGTKFGIGRWLPMLSLAIDFHVGKGAELPFHVTNLLIHGVTFFAVFALMLFLWKAHAGRIESEPGIPVWLLAIGGAALWALNPVQSNAVTYIVQRMASLVTLFYVTGTACYVAARLRMQKGEKGWRVVALFLFAVVSALCAFVSKENARMLPVMIVLTEIWFFRGALLLRMMALLRRRRIVVMIAGLILLGLLGLQLSISIEGFLAGYTIRHFSLLERLLTEGRVVLWYVSLFFWPAPSRLSLEHDVILSTSLFNPPTTILSFGLLGLLFALILFYRRSYPLMTYGLLWYFVNLVIESTVVPLELVFEHRLYLPSVGLVLFAVALCVEVFSKMAVRLDIRQRVALVWSLFMICSAALSLLTFSRNEAWSSLLSITADSVLKAPLHPRPRGSYGKVLMQAGRYEEALEESEKAIALGKDNFECHLTTANNIVLCLFVLDRLDEAAQRGEYFLRSIPRLADEGDYPNLLLAITLVHQRAGRPARAYDSLDEALLWMRRLPYEKGTRDRAEFVLREILNEAHVGGIDVDGDGSPDPGKLSVDTWMAKAFLKWGETSAAEELLKVASQNPEDVTAREMLASLEETRRRNQQASQDWSFEKGYVRKPFSQHNLLVGSAYLLSKIPHFSNMLWCRETSRWLLERALQVDPHSADARLLLAWQDHAAGDVKAAVSRVREVIAERPDYARAWIQLGFFLRDVPEEGSSAEAFQEGLRLYPGYPQRVLVEKIISGEEGTRESVADDSRGKSLFQAKVH